MLETTSLKADENDKTQVSPNAYVLYIQGSIIANKLNWRKDALFYLEAAVVVGGWS